MNPMSMLKMKLFAFVFVALVVGTFSACGDDSSSSQDVENEISNEKSSSSGKKVSSSSLESNVDIKEGPVSKTDSIDVSEYDENEIVKDKQSERTYNLLVSGLNVWTVENIDKKPVHPTATCYDYADSLCNDYGKLYTSEQSSEDVCPEGFQIPKAKDWRLLLESKDDYQPQFAGKCYLEYGSPLECNAIKDTAFYLTQDDSVVVISRKGSWSVKKNVRDMFSSLRCVKRLSIVEKKKNLPECNSDFSSQIVYVIEKDSAYKCSSSEWNYAKTYSVCKDGEKYLYKGKSDSLYSCKNGMWHIADLSDINKPCLEENRHKDVTLSGNRYACTDTGWVKLPYPGSVLGECYLKHFGVIAKADSVSTFVCRTSGEWTSASPLDLFGDCDDDNDQKIVTVDTMEYFCSSYRHHWLRKDESAVAEKYGFCTTEREKEKLIYNNSFYLCDRGYWVFKSDFDYFDECTSAMWDSVGAIGNKRFLCNRYLSSWQTVPLYSFEEYEGEMGCMPAVYGKILTMKQNGAHYICKLNNNLLYALILASEYEMKFGLCGRDTNFVVLEDSTAYVCRSGTWSKRTQSRAEMKFGACIQDTTYSVADDSLYYTCKNGNWSNRKLSSIELKVGICPSDTVYDVLYGDYLYTCKNGTWSSRKLNSYEEILGICPKDTVYEIQKENFIYTCKNGSWSERKIDECEYKFGKCTSDSNYVKTFADSACFCNSGSWNHRLLDPVEIKYGICDSDTSYIAFDRNYTYTCEKGSITSSWTSTEDYKKVLGKCKGAAHGIDTVVNGQRFVCDTLTYDGWNLYTVLDTIAGTHCNKSLDYKGFALEDSTYYVCTTAPNGKYYWKRQSYSLAMPTCDASREGEIAINGLTRSICRNSSWIPADTFHVTDVRNNRSYAAIKIGQQTWMSEPLAYIPEGQDVFVTRSAFAVNEIKNGDTLYYPWSVAMGLDRKYDSSTTKSVLRNKTVIQGICFDGWHLPSRSEAEQLQNEIAKHYISITDFYGSLDRIGIHFNKLRELGVSRNSTTGVDSVYVLDYEPVDRFWTSDEVYSTKAYAFVFKDVSVSANPIFEAYKYRVYTVRCVKDY